MADGVVRVEAVAAPAMLPPAALALFGGNAFSTIGWYRCVAAAAMQDGWEPYFQLVRRGRSLLGVFPMQRSASGLAALTTPYTGLWSPLLRADLDAATLDSVGVALGRAWRRWPETRLEAFDAGAPWAAPLLRGVRRTGLVPLHFDHFGNWHLDVAGQDWLGYLATRPGELRSAINRRSRRLMQGLSASFTLVEGQGGLEAGLAAYAQVYAASWKEAEPFSAFNPMLMREVAAAGGLRLGLLHLDGAPIAVQFWMLHDGWAGVQKLAHHETHRRLAPGTVLTALMIRHLLEHEAVTALDFGRGDDPYKRSWTGERRQRVGVVLASPWHVAGAMQIARHWAGRVRGVVRRKRSKKLLSVLSRT